MPIRDSFETSRRDRSFGKRTEAGAWRSTAPCRPSTRRGRRPCRGSRGPSALRPPPPRLPQRDSPTAHAAAERSLHEAAQRMGAGLRAQAATPPLRRRGNARRRPSLARPHRRRRPLSCLRSCRNRHSRLYSKRRTRCMRNSYVCCKRRRRSDYRRRTTCDASRLDEPTR